MLAFHKSCQDAHYPMFQPGVLFLPTRVLFTQLIQVTAQDMLPHGRSPWPLWPGWVSYLGFLGAVHCLFIAVATVLILHLFVWLLTSFFFAPLKHHDSRAHIWFYSLLFWGLCHKWGLPPLPWLIPTSSLHYHEKEVSGHQETDQPKVFHCPIVPFEISAK